MNNLTLKKELLSITLKKGLIGVRESHKATVYGLGLKKINSISYLENTSSIRGMVKKVSYLISYELIEVNS